MKRTKPDGTRAGSSDPLAGPRGSGPLDDRATVKRYKLPMNKIHLANAPFHLTTTSSLHRIQTPVRYPNR